MTVELSNELEIMPLTPTHLFAPLALHALILVIATSAWLAELCCGIVISRRRIGVSRIFHGVMNVQPIRVQP